MSLRDASNPTIRQARDTCLSHGTRRGWKRADHAGLRRIADPYAGIGGLLWATTKDV
jgi:hypothetical protein